MRWFESWWERFPTAARYVPQLALLAFVFARARDY
jgi:hypothetical protein